MTVLRRFGRGLALALLASALAPLPAGAAPVTVGTTVAFTLAAPEDSRAAQAALDRVLVHEPHRGPGEVRVAPRPGGGTGIAFGRTMIAAVDPAQARALGYARPEALALAWARRLAEAVSRFQASRRLPARVLYRNAEGSDFVYVRTTETLADPAALTDTGFVFSPADFDYGVGARPAGQAGFALFVADDALAMPTRVYLNAGGGPYTAYRRAEDDLP